MSVTLELDSARRELAALPEVDVERMAMERLGRLQAEMAARDVGGMLLYDPVNVRYATGTRNMQVWAMHNSSRYCLVPAEGGVLVFDFVHCEHLSEHLPTVAESRPARMWIFHIAGRQARGDGPNHRDRLRAGSPVPLRRRTPALASTLLRTLWRSTTTP